MTFHSPTQTNPPFTTPPTWPFTTTAERWETDYRLRLLETALVYLWTNQVGGSPTGPASGDLTGVYPSPIVAKIQGQAVSAIGPSSGQVLEWNGTTWIGTTLPAAPTTLPPNGPAGGDLGGTYPNPKVDMNLPAPVTTGTTVQSFTDDLGDIWVAKNGVRSGNWFRARDVLHARIYRTAAFSVGVGTANSTPMDTVDFDPYGMAGGGGGMTMPIPGLYLLESCLGVSLGANQWVRTYHVITGKSAGDYYAGGYSSAVAIGAAAAMSALIVPMNAGDTQIMGTDSIATLTGTTGKGVTWISASYIGTG